MACTPFTIGEAHGFICNRGRRRLPACSVPGCGRLAPYLCDAPVARPGRKSQTCDAKLCDTCAVAQGPDRHFCPPHERLKQQQPLLFQENKP